MAKLTIQQLWTLVKSNGASDDQALIGVAIILAESGGVTNARNKVSGGKASGSMDRGLWQINSYYHPQVTDAQADDPQASTAYAKQISKNWTDWSPWTTYKSGSWKKQVANIMKANPTYDGKSAVTVGGGLSNVSDVLNAAGLDVPALPATGVLDLVRNLAAALTNTEFWKRFGIGLLGVALVVVALFLFSDNLNLDDLSGAATAAATKGAAA